MAPGTVPRTFFGSARGGEPVLPRDPHELLDVGRADVREAETDLAYWRQQLASLPTLELPTDHPRPPQAEVDKLLLWAKTQLAAEAQARRAHGRVGVRRLKSPGIRKHTA